MGAWMNNALPQHSRRFGCLIEVLGSIPSPNYLRWFTTSRIGIIGKTSAQTLHSLHSLRVNLGAMGRATIDQAHEYSYP